MLTYLDKLASLTPLSKHVICDKATEYPHSGHYNTIAAHGTYLCRRCGLALFLGTHQFHAGCGWPSFDEDILDTVKQVPDVDGLRTEIVCSRCDAHLGHIFTGEQLTPKNLRYCVNSVSLDYVPKTQVHDTHEAIVAGGCFWGIDYYLKKLAGVLKVEVGYTGGHIKDPTYHQVCEGNSGHYEAVRIIFDANKLDYSQVIKRFFEIHDPTQASGQGPDLGPQYQSAIFIYNDQQYLDAAKLIEQLKLRGYHVITRLLNVSTFWPAEDYHQDYYGKTNKLPYCHHPVSRFG